ncbi:MAG TPA: sigma-70 family RNA polymerase sigma factor [Candidatus Methylomirabilis sp.]|jgi:RNA polymerase sigma-70 factor (ECF subfamily)
MVPPEERDDERALVERAKDGDEAAFASLVHRHNERAFAVAYRLVRHREDALDIAQEAFVRAYQALAGFKGEARFSTWLHRIVVNQALDHLRRRSQHGAAEYRDARALEEVAHQVVAPTPNPHQAMEATEMRRLIQEGMAGLPAEQRTALILREIEGLSYKEIARAMRCSIGTVMSRLHYARRKMQAVLRPHR